MGKIPRIELGNRPSAAVGVAGVDTTAGNIAKGLAGLAATGFERAAAEEARLQEAMKAKQKIVDTISAGRMANDFDEQSFSVQETLKSQFGDEPEKAVAEYIREMNSRADELYKSAPNDAVRQYLAADTQNRIASGQREMHEWVSARQTQKAKVDAEDLLRGAAVGAERLAAPGAVASYIERKKQELGGYMEMAFGGKAADKFNEFKEQAVMAWVNYNLDNDPLGVVQALDHEVLIKNIPDVKQRDAIRREARKAFEGLSANQEYALIRDAAENNNKYVNMYERGSLTASNIYAERRKLEAQRGAIGADKRFDEAEKKKQLAVIDKQTRVLDAINNFYMRGKDKGIDNDDTVAELMRFQDGLFGKDAGENREDLAAWAAQQERLFVALGDRKITQGTFNTMYKELALAYPGAAAAEEKQTGGVWASLGFKRRNARQAGVVKLNDQVKIEGQDFDAKDRATVYLRYAQYLADAANSGEVSNQQAETLALKAFEEVAGNKSLGGGR